MPDHKNKNFSQIFQLHARPHHYYGVIKEDLLRVFSEFHNNGIINQSTNATFIALFQKGDE